MKKMLRPSAPTSPPPVPPLRASAADTVTTRRVEVTIEREWTQEFVATNPAVPTSFQSHCNDCGRRVTMINPAAAAVIAHVSVRTVYRWVDDKKLHFLESPTGELYLCADSIQAPSQTPATTKQLPSGDPR